MINKLNYNLNLQLLLVFQSFVVLDHCSDAQTTNFWFTDGPQHIAPARYCSSIVFTMSAEKTGGA